MAIISLNLIPFGANCQSEVRPILMTMTMTMTMTMMMTTTTTTMMMMMMLCTDECTCQSMVSWSFQQLDVDYDGRLSDTELVPLKSTFDVMESACISEFTAACDHDKDGQLSEKEWCCCYADVCE